MPAFQREAVLEWIGDVVHGSGRVTAGSEAFTVAATFPRLAGEPAGATTPEELLAASHATCFGIALRSVLGQRGATVERIQATATLTAEKGGGRIRLVRADLVAHVGGLGGLDPEALEAVAQEAEAACTISVLLRATVPVSVRVQHARSPGGR